MTVIKCLTRGKLSSKNVVAIGKIPWLLTIDQRALAPSGQKVAIGFMSFKKPSI